MLNRARRLARGLKIKCVATMDDDRCRRESGGARCRFLQVMPRLSSRNPARA